MIPKKSSLREISWADIRDQIKTIHPELFSIIDDISPDKKFPLFVVRYPYGANIIKEGLVQLPNQNGNLESFGSKNIRPFCDKIKRREIPAIMLLKNSAEMYYEMPDRVISGYSMRPGNLIGIWNQFDDIEKSFVKWIWNLSSGARTIYMLPKVTNSCGHRELRKKFDIRAPLAKSYRDQWNIFANLANSPLFYEDWESEVLIFTDSWFDKAKNDPAWKKFRKYLFQEAWRDSYYWRNTSTFELIWEDFISNIIDVKIKSTKQSLYFACIAKQIIHACLGLIPSLTIATDNTCAPIASLQKAYIEEYKLKDFIPTFMCSRNFAPNNDKPAYYSLQYLNMLESIPATKGHNSILSTIPEIQYILNLFIKSLQNNLDKNHYLQKIFANIQLEFFHNLPERRNHILPTSLLAAEDERFTKKIYPCENNTFSATSHIINGCVRFKNNHKTKG